MRCKVFVFLLSYFKFGLVVYSLLFRVFLNLES